MKIEVESGIPIPKGGRRHSWPFNTMDVGQSFAVPVKKAPTPKSMMGRYGDKKFTSRTIVENGTKVCRIWRTA